MKRRKILAAGATTLVVAAALSAASPAVAADTTVQFYGHLDLSIDDITKGIKDPTAVGKLGWQADISSNLSYFGFRGDHDIGGGNRIVFHVGTPVGVARTSGSHPVNPAYQRDLDNQRLRAVRPRHS